MVKCVVKREGHQEEYDEKKVYASAYAAALSCHKTEIESENIAESVMNKVNRWVKDRHDVTSDQLKDEIFKFLNIVNEDIAFMYESHLDIN